jgi:DNA helicase-2/ATP-dependent DNA helicase PcrA
VSPLQLRLLRAWLGDRSDLCVVGDPDQSIYAFAGAEAGYLRGFTRTFPGAQVVRLERNYRSTPEIVAVAEAVLADAEPGRRPRVAARPSGPRPVVTGYETDEAEAAGIAALLPAVRATHGTWSAAAILYRTNAQSARFEEALGAAGIPFRVVGEGRFLERPEVKAAIDALRRGQRSAPGRSFAEHVEALEHDAASLPEERREHVATLVRLAEEYLAAAPGAATLDGFETHLSATLRREAPDGAHDRSPDAVQLLTFHRAKGLEFPAVFVTGLERGLVPIAHADTPFARAEERRLLYVALSRAERELHCTYAQQRTLGSRRVPRSRSPWLGIIDPQHGASRERGGGRTVTKPSSSPRSPGLAQTRAALAAQRGDGGGTAPWDDALLTALKEWRRNLARASGVPAYVIFPDSTLQAVAATKPAHHTALLALPGIGPVKAQRHGDAVLLLVRSHAS